MIESRTAAICVVTLWLGLEAKNSAYATSIPAFHTLWSLLASCSKWIKWLNSISLASYLSSQMTSFSWMQISSLKTWLVSGMAEDAWSFSSLKYFSNICARRSFLWASFSWWLFQLLVVGWLLVKSFCIFFRIWKSRTNSNRCFVCTILFCSKWFRKQSTHELFEEASFNRVVKSLGGWDFWVYELSKI